MTDKKISELNAMTASEIANDDEIVISDTSATHTKKTPISELSTFFGINPEGQRDTVGAMFNAGSHSGVTVTYDDPNDAIDIVLNGSVTDAELGHLNGVTSDIQTQINGKAGLASPAFTGNPTAPTQTADNNSTRIATTSYVQSELTNYASDTATFTNKGGAISQWTNDSGFMTASSTNTLTNKSGNISQWTNNSNYETPTSTATLQNKTISGSNNTISNLPYSAISGVADEDLSSVSASHDTIPTAKATKAYVDAQISGIDTVAEAGDTSITSPSSGQILVHDGSDSFDNKTASVTLTGAVTGTANMSATGAVSVATTIPTNTITINGQSVALGGSATIPSVLNSGGTFIGEVHLNDDILLSFGGASGSGDFSISHESSTGDTILAEGGSGNLKILASNLELRNANNSQHYITANDGGDTILYKAGSERARTSTNGFNVTGDIAVTGTVDGVDVASLNTTVGNLATVATSGAYGDLSGSPTLATVATSGAYGDLSGTPTIPSAVTNNNQLTNGAGYITSTITGDVTFTGGSANIVFDQSDNALEFADNAQIKLGSSGDLALYHSGNHTFIEDTGAGDLYIRNDNTVHIQNASGTESKALFTSDGAVELYFDNSKKLETVTGGATITGDITATHFVGILNGGTAFKKDVWFTDNGATPRNRFYFGDNSHTYYGTGQKHLFRDVNGTTRFELDGSGNAIFSGNVSGYGSPSDINLKENIEVIPNALDKIAQLKGVTFNYKKDGKKSTGLIAQDLEKVLPEVVYETHEIDNEEEKFKAINYGNTVGLLVEAIKELKAEIKELKKG